MTRSRAAVTGAVVAASLVLTGCGGGARAGGEPAWEPSLTPSAAPDWPPDSVLDVPEPVQPVVTGPPSKKQAREFAGYLFDEIDYALRTTYVDEVLRTGECELCAYVSDLAERARKEHLSHEFEDWSGQVLAVRRLPPADARDEATYWELDVVVWEPEVRTLDEHGREVRTIPPSGRTTVLEVGLRRGQWRLFRWMQVGPGHDPEAV